MANANLEGSLCILIRLPAFFQCQYEDRLIPKCSVLLGINSRSNFFFSVAIALNTSPRLPNC